MRLRPAVAALAARRARACCVLALVPACWRRARGARCGRRPSPCCCWGSPGRGWSQETRETRPDIGLLVVDQTARQVGARARHVEAARAGIEARAAKLPDLELRTVEVPEGGNEGTRLFTAMERALGGNPARPAGRRRRPDRWPGA